MPSDTSWLRRQATFIHPYLELRSAPAGGGRGLFVTSDVPAGTVLLTEPSALPASNCAASPEAYLRQMLFTEGASCARAFELVVTVLHPVCIGEVGDAVLREARAEYAPAVARLDAEVEAADSVGNVGRFCEASSGEADILLRLLLVMRFNAFDGGIFVAFAMLNHACLPNCAKLLRKGAGGSELVAVRDVVSGEEVRISYLAPMEQPFCVRKAAIEGQHYFSLGSDSVFPHGCEELRPGVSKNAVAGIHSVLGELEGESRKRMRQASFEERMSALIEEMDDALGKNHVLWLRCWKLVVRVCDARLGRFGRGGFDDDPDKLAEYQKLILRQMSAARKVLDGLKHLWSGGDHHEMATFHDVASEAIRYALSSGGKVRAKLKVNIGERFELFQLLIKYTHNNKPSQD